jgi:uridine kinase
MKPGSTRKMKPFLIGLAGPSGAGKTTVSRKLKFASKRIEHMHLDTYLRSKKHFRMKGKFQNWESPSNIKFGQLLRHLKQLRAGTGVRFRTPKDQGGYLIEYFPKDIIIVEGFVLFKDKKVREMFDVKIFLDASTSLVLERRAKRRGGPIDEYDLKVVIPEYRRHGLTQKKYADYIIDAQLPVYKVKNSILRIIKNYISVCADNKKKETLSHYAAKPNSNYTSYGAKSPDES